MHGVKPGFQIVVPVARIVSVASNFWKRQGRSYGNAQAITQDDPCDKNDQSSDSQFVGFDQLLVTLVNFLACCQ